MTKNRLAVTVLASCFAGLAGMGWSFAQRSDPFSKYYCPPSKGPQTVGVFLVNLEHTPDGKGGLTTSTLGPDCTEDWVAAHYFSGGLVEGGSVHEYYEEESFGQVSVVGKVLGTFTIDDPYPDVTDTCPPYPAFGEEVDAQARAAGIDVDDPVAYSRRVYVVAPRVGCRLGSTGGPDLKAGVLVPRTFFKAGCPPTSAMTHEFGHTFGLGHAMLDLDLGGGPWPPTATQEVGDNMGYTPAFVQKNAVHKWQLGWIPQDRMQIIDGTMPGTYEAYLSQLEIIDPDNGYPQVVIVSFPDGSANDFYLSYRHATGRFDPHLDDDYGEKARRGTAGQPYLNMTSLHYFDRYCPNIFDERPVQHRSYLLQTLADHDPRGGTRHNEWRYVGPPTITFRQIEHHIDGGANARVRIIID